MSAFSFKELEDLGFEYITDGDAESYHQFVLDPENFFESDYLYSEKIAIGTYRVRQYAGGENKELANWEVELLVNKNKN